MSACLIVVLLLGGVIGHSLLQGQVSGPAAGPREPAQQVHAPVATGVPRELASYRDIVKQVLPAVVSVEARAKAVAEKPAKGPRRRMPLDNSQIPEEFRRFFEDFGQVPFDMEPQPHAGLGSGFIVDPTGIIVTNNHVVDGADQVVITLQDGRKLTSRDVKTDPKTDVAIVRVQSKERLPYLELGDSSAMEIGDRVLALGAPFGLTGTVTSGIISSKGRNLRMNMYEDFLQTDAAINPGNSGGPLVNLEGKVIGINSVIKSRSGGFQGVGLAISSNLVRNVMEQLIKHGVVRRGYLGVQIKDITDRDLAARLGVEKSGGVLVTQVYDNSPARKAGLKDGDVVTTLGGKQLRDGHDLQMTVAGLPLGKPVELNIIREGKPQKLEVTIEEQPQSFGLAEGRLQRVPRHTEEGVSISKIGVEVTDVTAEVAEKMGLKENEGALILTVTPGSLADGAGLDSGMVITRVDKQPVKSAESLRDAVARASLATGVLLQVKSQQGGTNYVLLRSTSGE
jgi:serine protease Do